MDPIFPITTGVTAIMDESCNEIKSCSETSGKIVVVILDVAT